MRVRQYKHVIWDWNGTLFDDAWLCVDIMNGLLTQRSLSMLTPSLYETIFDFPVSDYYQKLGFDFALEPFERLSNEFMGEYQRRLRECHLREGVREVLAQVRALGLTQSILSAMKQEMLQELVAYFDLSDYFVDIVGLSNHHAAGKLDVAQQWIVAQHLNPDEMIFVGDTTHDQAVAEALGITCIYIYSGHHSRERLAVGGRPLLNSLTDLYTLLEPPT